MLYAAGNFMVSAILAQTVDGKTQTACICLQSSAACYYHCQLHAVTVKLTAGVEAATRYEACSYECHFGGREVSRLFLGCPFDESAWSPASCGDLLHSGISQHSAVFCFKFTRMLTSLE